ncbi:MAG: phage tail tube protein [Rhodocyclaceae bacterium]|nr:phage tail tube protein [Rhodocyclaceae bacterium]
MSKTLATRTAFHIAKTYGASVSMTALTNAAEAVATLAAGHGAVVGDYLEVTSGWGRLNGSIVRVKAVATNDATLEGFNSTSTTNFPAGAGIGSIRRITAWDRLSQVFDISSSGGDQQYEDATDFDSEIEVKIPTLRNAVAQALQFFDDPSLPWYATVAAASDAATPSGFRMDLPSGSKLVANAYWSLQKEPIVQKNKVLAAKIDLSYAAPSMRYAT